MVKHLRTEFDLAYIYVWHALAGYWNGIATSEAIEVAKYQAEIIDVRPPDSVLEVEPAMAWNPSTVAGLGAVRDPAVLYEDMHAYLAQAGVYFFYFYFCVCVFVCVLCVCWCVCLCVWGGGEGV